MDIMDMQVIFKVDNVLENNLHSLYKVYILQSALGLSFRSLVVQGYDVITGCV